MEIKSSSTYKANLLKGLKKITQLLPAKKRAYLVYAGEPLTLSNGIIAINYSQIDEIFN